MSRLPQGLKVSPAALVQAGVQRLRQDLLIQKFLAEYSDARKAFRRFAMLRHEDEEAVPSILMNVARIAMKSVLFDQIRPTADLFRLVFFERMDFALEIYCDLCDPESMGYTHRKSMDFLPAALRARVDGIQWTPPEADKGWFSDAGSYVPGTSVKL